MLHDQGMNESIAPAEPDPESITAYILETFFGTDLVVHMNARFFSLDSEKHWPNYATIVTTV